MTTLSTLLLTTWMMAAPMPSIPSPLSASEVSAAVLTVEELSFEGTVSQRTMDDLREHLDLLEEDEGRIGERRRMRLWIARSYIDRWDVGEVPERNLRVEEEIADVVGSSISKVWRSRAEEQVGFSDLRNRLDERRDHGSDGQSKIWSLSPRVGVGHDPWLGSKLRIRTARSYNRLPDFSIGFKQHLLQDEMAVAFEMQFDDIYVGLEHTWDHEDFGDTVQMKFRWRI